MKTQLLEDFDESGSAPSRAAPLADQAAASAAQSAAQPTAPADLPSAPLRPAVWQRPRQDEAAPPEPAPAAPPAPAARRDRAAPPRASASPPPPPPPPPRPAPQDEAPIHPRGFAPQPGPSGTTTIPLGDTTAPAWPQGVPAGGDPDWLRERLARDAALQDRTESNGLWRRRLASWGAAGVLLALLAGGGLWLYEQSRVEGALVVVANTNPAPETHTVRPAGVPAPAALPASPAVANIEKADPLPVPAQAEGSGAGAVGGTAGPSTASGAAEPQTPAFADRTVVPVATDAAPAAKPKHRRSRASRRAEPEARAEVRESERSYRQRYEETLMQCRAHGYDERQCLQRGCEMTRYGFACKG